MLVKILLALMFVQHCSTLDLSSNGAEKSGALESLKKHIGKKAAGQDQPTIGKKSSAISRNHRPSRSDNDTVSQEEFDEAIAAITAMYDMLSVQVMSITEELQNKRCETGMKTLYCIHELCYVDFEYDLIDRGGEGDIFHLNLNFQQAFDQPPVVMVSASNNYYEIAALEYAAMNGFFHSPARDITTTGFSIDMQFSSWNWWYYDENYFITWIACRN